MGFTIPNYTNAVATGVGDQAEPDSVDFQILGNSSNGVVFDLTNYATNGVVTKTSTTSNTVNVAPYKVIIDGVYYHNDSTSITVVLDGGDANKRFDLVVIPKATPLVPTFRKGDSSSTNPEFPDLVEGDIVLAAIYRSGSGSAGYIDTPNIVDKRFFISSNTTWINANEPTLVANSDGAKAANGDIWITTANAALGKSSVWLKVAGVWENLAKYIATSSANTANNIVVRDASGNFAANVITANTFSGTTFNGTTFSGKANTAGVADSANAVTWANVSSKPTNIVLNDNGATNYTINTLGSAGYAQTAGYAVDAGEATELNSSGQRIYYSGGSWNSSQVFYFYNGFNLAGGAAIFNGPIYLPSLGSSGSTNVVVDAGGLMKYRSLNPWSLRDMKDQIEPLNDALSKVKSLQPKTFRFKEDVLIADEPFDAFNRREQLQYGFIVDEIESSETPDLVAYGSNDGVTKYIQSWKIDGVLSLAVGAIKELLEKVELLEARIEDLEGQ